MAQPGSLNKDLIYLKVDDAYTVWFKASKNFLLLEEPAFYVLDLIVKGLTRDKISREFSHKFGYPIHEVDVFVDDISNKFAGFLIPKPGKNQELNKTQNYNIDSIKFLSEKTYLLGNKKASIKYGDKELESVIHPLINHFIVSDSGSPNLHYYFYRQEGNARFPRKTAVR